MVYVQTVIYMKVMLINWVKLMWNLGCKFLKLNSWEIATIVVSSYSFIKNFKLVFFLCIFCGCMIILIEGLILPFYWYLIFPWNNWSFLKTSFKYLFHPWSFNNTRTMFLIINISNFHWIVFGIFWYLLRILKCVWIHFCITT